MNAPKSVPSTVALCAAVFYFNFLLFPTTLGLASENLKGLLNLSLYGRGLTCSYLVNWAYMSVTFITGITFSWTALDRDFLIPSIDIPLDSVVICCPAPGSLQGNVRFRCGTTWQE